MVQSVKVFEPGVPLTCSTWMLHEVDLDSLEKFFNVQLQLGLIL